MLRASLTWFTAALLCCFALLAASIVWLLGLSRYSEDYCGTAGRLPTAVYQYGTPQWSGPTTLRCAYAGHRMVTVTDARPLLWTVALAVAAVLGVWVVCWSAHRATRRPAVNATVTSPPWSLCPDAG